VDPQPYTPAYFKRFAPLANELDNIRVNDEGTIDIQYMAQIGDESLFLGRGRPGPMAVQRPKRKVPMRYCRWSAGEKIAPSIVDDRIFNDFPRP
jgi:hypothetical protein